MKLHDFLVGSDEGHHRPPRSIDCVVLSRPQWDAVAPSLEASRTESSTGCTVVCCGVFRGRIREDVFAVQHFSANPSLAERGIPLFCARKGTEELLPEILAHCERHVGEKAAVALWSGRRGELPRFFRRLSASPFSFVELSLMAFDLNLDPFSRLKGIFESRALSGSTMAICGMGSFGSTIAVLLSRCGIGKMILLDRERVALANVTRGEFDLRDVGQFKTLAIAERVKHIHPACEVTTHEVDVLKAPHILSSAIRSSNIVACCTDEAASRYLVNYMCLIHNVIAVYGGAYERALGGIIFRVIPGQHSPCYDCVIGSVEQELAKRRETRARPLIPYTDIHNAEEAKRFVAEPGMAMDVNILATIQAKMTLVTLLRGTDSNLQDMPCDLIFFGNQAEWIFPQQLYCQFARTVYREDCYTHRTVWSDPCDSEEAKRCKDFVLSQIAVQQG